MKMFHFPKNGLLFVLMICLGGPTSGNEFAGITIRMIAQDQPSFDVWREKLPEFEQRTGMRVEVVTFNENERRSKSRLDAATGTGAYQVYYIDEANRAEFASSGWIYPILDYYPEAYDYDDFLAVRKEVASYKGIPYFAPILGGGDFLYYRKDLLQQHNLAVPQTLDDLMDAVKKLHNPPHTYGWMARGQRGYGMNVWRWVPFFRSFGGQWFEGDEPIFNSEAAIKATQIYMNLMEYAPPGTNISTWNDSIEAFRAGKLAFIVESTPLASRMFDPQKSKVVNLIGLTKPPAPLLSSGYSHGFAISVSGNKTIKSRQASALLIAWVTSKAMELEIIKAGHQDFSRTSTVNSPEFQRVVPKEIYKALLEIEDSTQLLIWDGIQWPQVGDYLGVVLEELFTGEKTNLQQAFDEASQFAKKVIVRTKRN